MGLTHSLSDARSASASGSSQTCHFCRSTNPDIAHDTSTVNLSLTDWGALSNADFQQPISYCLHTVFLHQGACPFKSSSIVNLTNILSHKAVFCCFLYLYIQSSCIDASSLVHLATYMFQNPYQFSITYQMPQTFTELNRLTLLWSDFNNYQPQTVIAISMGRDSFHYPTLHFKLFSKFTDSFIKYNSLSHTSYHQSSKIIA